MQMHSMARLAAAAILALACCAAQAAPDPQRILAASDAVRNPSEPFTLNVTLTQYTDGKQTDSNALTA
ncbi:hypothetical protein BLA13014_00836 [Burkholderia aenigmatica]|uniref:Uncharacterized protein n=1 Tax=Burkholderia aenigmatica TaxID=2015348 RepID=A0A6P2HZZ2_9BURK|nr:hypothetical protein BLA13014_00836 [Burkholderia aenigmatica]